MQLASHDDIVADQDMAGQLMHAFDELITQCNNDITSLQTQRGQMITEFNNSMGPLESEMTNAQLARQGATTTLNTAVSRVDQLKEKVSSDEADLEAWETFVTDEGIRCEQEESSYNTRIDERTETMRVVAAVIELFETRFVEMNDYINS